MSAALILAILSLAIWVYLLLGRGMFWREVPRPAPPPPTEWPGIVAVIPARNEVETIGTVVGSLLGQCYAGPFAIVLVDDHSDDGTAAAALAAARACGGEDRLTIVPARPLPSGWTGKLWAVSEGLRHVDARGDAAPYILLTDADIEHHASNLAELVARAEAGSLDLASLMVLLRCRSFAERALVPAFVLFFAMLYPFAWINDPKRKMAGAAGGCMLVRRSALSRIGGIASIRGELIDDCALGAKLKEGGRIWLGLSDRTRSLRPYPRLGDIWRMIARTAYTQLHYSPILLAGTVLGLGLTFLVPPILSFWGGVSAIPAILAWALMSVAFLPILRVYHRPLITAPLLPLIASFYLAATIDSARRHWQGKGGEWKGRVQQREPA